MIVLSDKKSWVITFEEYNKQRGMINASVATLSKGDVFNLEEGIKCCDLRRMTHTRHPQHRKVIKICTNPLWSSYYVGMYEMNGVSKFVASIFLYLCALRFRHNGRPVRWKAIDICRRLLDFDAQVLH